MSAGKSSKFKNQQSCYLTNKEEAMTNYKTPSATYTNFPPRKFRVNIVGVEAMAQSEQLKFIHL